MHQFLLHLHNDYPRRPPVITWRTAIFHPNILPPERGGATCIGGWTPSESLNDLVVRLVDMAQYRNYSLKSVLNEAAAEWARRNASMFPLDSVVLTIPE